jgi:hypothetical protein
MLALLSIIGVIVGIYGVVTEAVPLGIIFVISLAVFLYALFSLLNKGMRLTELGIGIMVVSLLLLVYTVCYLFLRIDVKAMLGL